MNKEKVLTYIKQHLSSKEDFIGFFQAQKKPGLWLYFMIGPLSLLAIRAYFIAVTDKGIHFHRLNFFGKFSGHDFFSFEEITKIKTRKGMIKLPIVFFFSNGRKLKIKALKKGRKNVARIEDSTLDYIKKRIQAA